MPKLDIHRKSMDELPLSEFGWQWLGEVGRAGKADKVLRPDFETNGGLVSAWRGNDLTCYFVLIRDAFNWSDMHCQPVEGMVSRSDLQVTRHDNSEVAAAIGHQWLVAHQLGAPLSHLDVNRASDGACIVSVWEPSRRLLAYFTVIPSPEGHHFLVCKLLSNKSSKSEGSF